MLLAAFERAGLAIPLVQEPTRKTHRSRGAGAAQDKKKERRHAELVLLRGRVVELEAILVANGWVEEEEPSEE